jgi:Rad3-related DNA helicase
MEIVRKVCRLEISLREWQKERFDEAINALQTKKILLLNAPTGAGKTLFVLLLGKELGKRVLFLTRTHSEFEPVTREAKRLGLKVGYLFGKNSVCPYASKETKPEDIDCKECVLRGLFRDLNGLSPSQILQISKTASDFCPYYSLKSMISEADVIAASYMYFFDPNLRKYIVCNHEGCLKPSDLMVVVDEAHNLISADEWFSLEIGKKSVEEALKEVGEVEEKTKSDLTSVKDFLNELIGFFNSLNKMDSCKELPLYPQPSPETLIQMHNAIKAYLNMKEGPIKRSHLRAIYKFYHTDGDVFNCEGKLTVVPSNVQKLINNAFNHASMVVLMSGTLPIMNIDGYKIDVDLKIGKPEYYYCNHVTSIHKFRPINAPKYAEIIKKIYKQSPSNVLIYFPSYDFKDEVRKYLAGIPILEESRRITHEEILNLMKDGKYAVLLVINAKESEGIEFRDESKNLFNDLILAGLPYPDISNDLVTRRIKVLSDLMKKEEQGVAHELTRIKIKQTIGRAFRDPNDYVKIYLCDKRYKEYFSDLGLEEKNVKPFA